MNTPRIYNYDHLYDPDTVNQIEQITKQPQLTGIVLSALETELAFEQFDHIQDGSSLEDHPGLDPKTVYQTINNVLSLTLFDFMTRHERDLPDNRELAYLLAYSDKAPSTKSIIDKVLPEIKLAHKPITQKEQQNGMHGQRSIPRSRIRTSKK